MAFIRKIEEYHGEDKTTLNGVVESDATFEFVEDVLIIRTSTCDTIHIRPGVGRELLDILVDYLVRMNGNDPSTRNELTINDAYLIAKHNTPLIKVSYRNELKETLETLGVVSDLSDQDPDVSDIHTLRDLVQKADDNTYQVYNLTRL